MKTILGTESLNDTSLVELSRNGDREAFGRIVERYQSLICALTYSACGNLQNSEDLAQVTFITAWCQLPKLQEPGKLKSWLCGIARNVTNNSFRQDKRTPTAHAEVLDDVDNVSSGAATPCDQVISKEEEAILWRSLGELPTTYREPLVLFYRQHQSVAEVAGSLDISEDVVRQRLSRGRTMLSERVASLVEGVLRGSGPTNAFTLGVMGALPAITMSTAAASVGATAAKGGATAKAATLAAVANVVLGPLLVVFGNYVSYRVSVDSARSDRERDYIKRFYRKIIQLLIGSSVVFGLVFWWARAMITTHHLVATSLVVGMMLAYLISFVALSIWSVRTRRKLLAEMKSDPHPSQPAKPAWEYCSARRLLGWPLLQIRMGTGLGGQRTPVKAWIAAGDCAVGLLFAFGGVAIAPFSIGGLAIGLVPFGGLAAGVFTLGGIGLGCWTFGGMAFGWQAFGGCAIAWNAAVGGFALARDFALGALAQAPQANNAAARKFVDANSFFRIAQWLAAYSFWINLLWIIPLMAWRRVLARHNRLSNP
jgi:RNA polymerase sigma factor (sigma-70 family)